MKIRNPKTIRRVAAVAAFVARGWSRTLRFSYRPLTRYVAADRPELIGNNSFIYAFWHEDLIMPALAYRGSDCAILASQHADGELMAQVAERYGGKTVRGSTTRGGTAALLRMLQSGWGARHLAITPDGPRGPRRKCKLGIIYLASRTGFPIATGGFGYARCWRANSWDRTAVPMPFSKVRGISAHTISVPPDISTSEMRSYQELVEEANDHSAAIAQHWAETGEFDLLGYKPPPDAEIIPEHQKVWSSLTLSGGNRK
jgi:lysophospholipid acyltransferase (LPLAT)-like uncharacterized protein